MKKSIYYACYLLMSYLVGLNPSISQNFEPQPLQFDFHIDVTGQPNPGPFSADRFPQTGFILGWWGHDMRITDNMNSDNVPDRLFKRNITNTTTHDIKSKPQL